MPVAGPRYPGVLGQWRPAPGYRNPGGELPERFNQWLRPPPVADPGRTPALMVITRRGCVQALGQVRALWRQSVDYIPASPSYSWTSSAPAPDRPLFTTARGLQISRALRYMTRSLYMGSGIDNSRYAGLHTNIQPKARGRYVTINVGQKRSMPTVRNRLTSFGSRIQPLNQASGAATE